VAEHYYALMGAMVFFVPMAAIFSEPYDVLRLKVFYFSVDLYFKTFKRTFAGGSCLLRPFPN